MHTLFTLLHQENCSISLDIFDATCTLHQTINMYCSPPLLDDIRILRISLQLVVTMCPVSKLWQFENHLWIVENRSLCTHCYSFSLSIFGFWLATHFWLATSGQHSRSDHLLTTKPSLQIFTYGVMSSNCWANKIMYSKKNVHTALFGCKWLSDHCVTFCAKLCVVIIVCAGQTSSSFILRICFVCLLENLRHMYIFIGITSLTEHCYQLLFHFFKKMCLQDITVTK